MKIRTIVTVGVGVATGLVVANYLTKGAVMTALSEVAANAKEKFSNKSAEAIDVVSDVVEDASDVVIDTVDSL